MDVSIIIVNYNTEKYIDNCIASILEQVNSIEYEIIIVDNDSKVGPLDKLKQKYPFVTILKLGANLGFGTANNRGVNIANGRNVFLLNPDTILLNNAAKILSDTIDNDKMTGVCGGNLYDEDLKPNHSYTMIFPGILNELNMLFLSIPSMLIWGINKHFNTTEKLLSVARVSGANMMLSRELYTQTQGFDEDFFMYTEETEYMYRIKKNGYNIISNPAAKIIHLEGKSFKHKDRATRFGLISRKKFLCKHCNNKFVIWLCDLILFFASFNFMIASRVLGRIELYKSWKYMFDNIYTIKENSKYNLTNE